MPPSKTSRRTSNCIVVLFLFHCSVMIVALKSKVLILKQGLHQRLVTFHASGGFRRYAFLKSGKNLRKAIFLKGKI